MAPLTKSQIISAVAETVDFTKKESVATLETIVNLAYKNAKNSFTIPGLGMVVPHPLLSQEERRYVVGSIKYVKQVLITTGSGWVDADPEIRRLKPDIYVVNEDGDKGGKREYCAERGMGYLVLKRTPASGLPKRSSTDLRGR